MSESHPHILLVEDDPTLGFLVRDSLESRGYRIDWVQDGALVLSRVMNHRYALCILDVMLPHLDGFEIARLIRKRDQQMPLMFLTARAMAEDRIHGFKVGADDYLTKPFSMEELLLRVQAILRRVQPDASAANEWLCSLGRYQLDVANQCLQLGALTTTLTYRETKLLRLFAMHPNQLLERETIEQFVWNDEGIEVGRSLDVFVSRLRKLIKADPGLQLVNIRGVGYKLVMR